MNKALQTQKIRTRKVSQKQLSNIAALHYKNILDCKAAIGHSAEDMNDRDYLKYKAGFAAKRKKAIEAAESAYKKEMDALEIIRAASPAQIQHILELPEAAPSRMVITDLVNTVLPTLGHEFSSFDIERAIEKTFPQAKGTYKRNSLSGTISRLKRRGVIEVTKEGSGPEGSLYRIKQ